MSNIKKVGQFKSGWEENKEGQLKKLSRDFSRYEKEYLLHLVREVRSFSIHSHLQRKIDTGQISFDIWNIKRMFKASRLDFHIKEFSVMPYDDGTFDHRVTIRSNRNERVQIDGEMKQCNLIFVLSLDTSEIVTAFYVSKYNHFDVVNEERYSPDWDIVSSLQGDEYVFYKEEKKSSKSKNRRKREAKKRAKERKERAEQISSFNTDLSSSEWLEVLRKEKIKETERLNKYNAMAGKI